ncbi:hypothetical protein [Tenacibaculum finnmarkense]|uniref:hypothetical protein n=1 Tax=Tenacibaculum finnmarkense TaxID=2781243 RepID=UPI001EFAC05D|nr:hypothetical protein [Tenacibaculum finnmarkense]MCG8750554.1 hypothetical protein [Tenacibaculum finnmarkense]
MSILALISIHGKLADFDSKFSPSGIDNYLSSYANYKYLFTGTIATCSAYFGLLRVKATLDSNLEKIKQDRFSEWKTIVQIRCGEIESLDPKMTREIIKIRLSIYNFLYDKNFKIQNINELTEVFNAYVSSLVGFFENTNKRQQQLGVYRNERHSYSFDSFRFVFYGMLDSCYEEMINDLEELYIQNLPNGRMIGEGHYQTALRDV